MPYTYKHLTNQQKSSIVRIRIEAYAGHVKLILSFNTPLEEFDHTISYISGGCAKATVEFGNEESPPIDLNFVDLFLEDLEMVLKYQSAVLTKFYVNCEHGTDEDRKKIMEGLKIILKPRTLKVKTLSYFGTTTGQAMLMVENFDPSELHRVWLFRVVDPKNFHCYLAGLSEVEVEDDGRCITFKLANPTSRSINSKNEKSVSEIVARTVFQNRLPMEIILGQLQCFDIERLRKASSRIRECVDLIKPNPHIETYSIRFDVCNAAGKLRTYIKLENGKFKDVEYFTQGNQVHWSGGNSFPGTDYKSICLNDTENTLKYQTECMEELIICFEYQDSYIKNLTNPLDSLDTADLSRRIGDIFKRREKPLKTKKFSMGSSSQMEVMRILPAIDTHFLKIIELLFPVEQELIENTIVRELSFQVDQLSQTVQWKTAEHLIAKRLTITTHIPEMNISHFVNLDILVKTLSSKDVAYLKNNLLESSKFQKYKIWFWESTIDESLHMLIGEPYRIVSNVKKVWYFRIPNTKDYVHIVLDMCDVRNEEGNLKPKLIIFTRVAEEATPFTGEPVNQCCSK
ncbi:unnamed protein product [Caenorhabditis nigoni]